ncbi:tetratricopeptide repeat protein (plasmid) [Deinococcus sp. KNUC1210]|uniref:tetratricopeptide repeat protein n=1 Tax=Deinococcus sp. KNUC1210 TaxID=2917691 RepID=UPI001EEFCC9D|nr:tetratricopeptide repeat protein [Deinococcus sp. KNUC1210]ULH14030.1 tetratricopeptide repeat protein [Deinococcus sp. KNUC1210]
MTDLPTSRDVHALNVAGRFQEALYLLDRLPDTGVLLWLRGVALHNLGRWDEAHRALDQARPLLSGDNLGRMLNDQAVYYDQAQRYTRALETYLQAKEAARNDSVMIVATTYNLGWHYLKRLNFGVAEVHLRRALQLGENGPVSERMEARIGVSTLDRANGQLLAARRRAISATEAAAGHRQASLAYRCLAHAYRHLGDLKEARRVQLRAVALAVADADLRTEQLILGVIDSQLGRDVDLEPLKAGAYPLDVTRALLHQAGHAHAAGQDALAHRLLSAAVAQDEPFALWDEAPHLPRLYQWALAQHPALTYREHHVFRPEIRVTALGRPGLTVAGREIVDLSVPPLTLLTYLIVNGQTGLKTLIEDLYGDVAPERARSRTAQAVRTVNRWLADPDAMSWEGGLLRLSSTWQWSADVQDALNRRVVPRNRVFLPGVRSEWVSRIQRQLDDLFE